MAAGIIRELAHRVPFNFSAELDVQVVELLEELSAAPIPEAEDENSEAA